MKPKIGITLGDINGVGPETIIKVLSDERIYKYCTPIIYGSTRVLSYYKKTIENKSFQYGSLKDWNKPFDSQANVKSCVDGEPQINIGEETEIAGKYALDFINAALKDWKDGHLDAIVTGPINKNTVAKAAEGAFTGHTEYITKFTETDESLMFLVSDRLRVGLVTNHLPLQDVAARIDTASIVRKIEMMDKSLREDFGIHKPRIAVLALNPHAGDKGLIGAEEQDIIIPAISQCSRNGIYAFGPYPTDGFFGSSDFKQFDAVLAMYHDQGLTPFKALVFDEGVNFTAGIPLVRTSPDHGTGYAIAGKGIASEQSLRTAIFCAIDVIRNRAEYAEMTANPVKKHIKKSYK